MYVDTFYAIDFDRCLGSVDACFGLLQDVLHDYKPVAVNEIEKAKEHVALTGETFLVFDYLKSIVPEEELEEIVREFTRRAQSVPGSLLEQGASEFIEWLKDTERAFGIITHGETKWQELKIVAAGLGDLPRLITTSNKKAEYIAKWQNDNKQFTVDSSLSGGLEIVADRVVLADDRMVAFEGLPLEAKGYWVVREVEVKSFQAGQLADNVTRVDYVDGIIAYEQ